ncbi:MAG: nucleoside/nucleotide kinase family protein [Clostridiales bacterium]|nr:nucleoside/nucleotide kinase family protein [Clostridiales bacterium]
MRCDFEVNGLPVAATFDGAAVDGILRPLIGRLLSMRAHIDRRLVAFLAGPPGCGKSTLSLLLKRLADEAAPGRLQALAMDGFHHAQSHIAAHTVMRDGAEVPMAKVKGSPESFDAPRLAAAIGALSTQPARPLRWPAYDRRLHDVVEGAMEVTGDIALVEGNWLLLDQPGFSALRVLCDYSIAIYADETLLKDRLIGRKRLGGADAAQAEAHYQFCDRPNILRYAAHTRPGDLNLAMTGDGAYRVISRAT